MVVSQKVLLNFCAASVVVLDVHHTPEASKNLRNLRLRRGCTESSKIQMAWKAMK